MIKHERKSRLEKFGLRFWRQLPTTAKRIEIIILIISILGIAVAIFSTIFFGSEAVTKRNLETMAKDYYENYYYENFLESVADPETMFEKYAKNGFRAVTLEQLLLFDNRRNASFAATMEQNCDTSATTIKIFPEEPFGKENYHIEYNYSCNF